MEKQKFSARVKQAMGEASITNLYQLNGMVPVHKAIPFGLQHILAMFVANIAPILIVGGACGLAASDMAMLIQSAMLIAGIGTLVQLFPIFHKIGSGLPIIGFDVRYGNQNFIDEGQNGYKIALDEHMDDKSKIALLAEKIVKLFTQADMEAFHEHSYEKAGEYLTEEVVERWKKLLGNKM